MTLAQIAEAQIKVLEESQKHPSLTIAEFEWVGQSRVRNQGTIFYIEIYSDHLEKWISEDWTRSVKKAVEMAQMFVRLI